MPSCGCWTRNSPDPRGHADGPMLVACARPAIDGSAQRSTPAPLPHRRRVQPRCKALDAPRWSTAVSRCHRSVHSRALNFSGCCPRRQRWPESYLLDRIGRTTTAAQQTRRHPAPRSPCLRATLVARATSTACTSDSRHTARPGSGRSARRSASYRDRTGS